LSVLQEFGDFLLANEPEITRRWVTIVDRSPEVTASEDLTYRQLLDHLPELCTELASTIKRPREQAIRVQTAHDASAHGRKRWRQGYKLEELIREICLIRSNFLGTWLNLFAAENDSFEGETRNAARGIVERFFDEVIVESTVQFVDDQSEAVQKTKTAATADAKSHLLRHVGHTLREPLGAILSAAEGLASERSLTPEARNLVNIIVRNAQLQAHNVNELVLAAELFSGARHQRS
jgi:signal transduction histidine kinase